MSQKNLVNEVRLLKEYVVLVVFVLVVGTRIHVGREFTEKVGGSIPAAEMTVVLEVARGSEKP